MSDIQQIAAKLLENETSEEVLEIKKQILRRIAMESDIKPSRIPAPLNITEIGGYYNLLVKMRETQMQQQMLASVLGLPVQQNLNLGIPENNPSELLKKLDLIINKLSEQ